MYMRVCASTYGTKEEKEEKDIKRVPSVSKKGNEECSAAKVKRNGGRRERGRRQR